MHREVLYNTRSIGGNKIGYITQTRHVGNSGCDYYNKSYQRSKYQQTRKYTSYLLAVRWHCGTSQRICLLYHNEEESTVQPVSERNIFTPAILPSLDICSGGSRRGDGAGGVCTPPPHFRQTNL